MRDAQRLAGERGTGACDAEVVDAHHDAMWCDLCGTWHAAGACPNAADPGASD